MVVLNRSPKIFSEEEKDVEREYLRNRYKNMADDKKKLKEYQKKLSSTKK